jgi:hypothetical protein
MIEESQNQSDLTSTMSAGVQRIQATSFAGKGVKSGKFGLSGPWGAAFAANVLATTRESDNSHDDYRVMRKTT